MQRSELFDVWAPRESDWSVWAKPALFAEIPLEPVPPFSEKAIPVIQVVADPTALILVDLPSDESITVGLALADFGYRPIPMYNAAYHLSGILNVTRIGQWIITGSQLLPTKSLSPTSPPSFLLDSSRQSGAGLAVPGAFDNRYIVFPQDFPSAQFLKSKGITKVILMLEPHRSTVGTDLEHVLFRWHEAGIPLFYRDPLTPELKPFEARRPSFFRSLTYRAMALFRLRRNSAGGFGAKIPAQAAGGHYRGGFG